jgi:hypothetical protein
MNADTKVPRLIALHAADYGGKDTAGSMIDELHTAPDTWVPFARRAFATKMKESIAAGFGIPAEQAVEWCDRLKQPDVTIMVHSEDDELDLAVSGRQYVRDFATAGHRELFDPNFWVDVVLPPPGTGYEKGWHAQFDHAAMCVITDLRFKSEASRVWECGGEVWAITGRGTPFDDAHLSNGDFEWKDADYFLDNSGSVEDLRPQIVSLLASPQPV